MKVYSTDGSILMQVQAIEKAQAASEIVFRGMVMGSMPVKGRITPAEARHLVGMLLRNVNWFFLLMFLFKRNTNVK